MRRLASALLLVAASLPFSCGLDPGGVYNGGGTGGGSLPVPSGTADGDGGTDGGGLGGAGQGTVRGQGLQACDVVTYACPPGQVCALYGAIDPAYADLFCGPTDLCSIVTCPGLKRCVVGSGSPPSLSCQ